MQRAGDPRALQRLARCRTLRGSAIRPGISVSAMVDFLAAEIGEGDVLDDVILASSDLRDPWLAWAAIALIARRRKTTQGTVRFDSRGDARREEMSAARMQSGQDHRPAAIDRCRRALLRRRTICRFALFAVRQIAVLQSATATSTSVICATRDDLAVPGLGTIAWASGSVVWRIGPAVPAGRGAHRVDAVARSVPAIMLRRGRASPAATVASCISTATCSSEGGDCQPRCCEIDLGPHADRRGPATRPFLYEAQLSRQRNSRTLGCAAAPYCQHRRC